jgi:hypothetical protein
MIDASPPPSSDGIAASEGFGLARGEVDDSQGGQERESSRQERKKVCVVGYCVVKLDMHKTYDRIEWKFLESMMLQLGFHEFFAELLMSCVKSIK